MKRWLVVAATVWGLVIAGLAYYSLRTGRPTAREQTSMSSALPAADQALGDFAAVLDPAATVTVLGGYTELDPDCRITLIRHGARYERVLTVYTKEGAEPALLDRLAAGVPHHYRAHVTHATKTRTLTAVAGNFVAVRGDIAAPGQVRITADTGCRPLDRPVGEAEPAPTAAASAPVHTVLDALGLAAQRWQTHRVSCPGGGALWTVEAAASGAAPGPLPDALRIATQGAAVVLARSDTYAYRSGSAGVAVHAAGDGLTVTSTTGCGA